jgi:hypothetical protein
VGKLPVAEDAGDGEFKDAVESYLVTYPSNYEVITLEGRCLRDPFPESRRNREQPPSPIREEV